jgi:hypothetical protein
MTCGTTSYMYIQRLVNYDANGVINNNVSSPLGSVQSFTTPLADFIVALSRGPSLIRPTLEAGRSVTALHGATEIQVYKSGFLTRPN